MSIAAATAYLRFLVVLVLTGRPAPFAVGVIGTAMLVSGPSYALVRALGPIHERFST